MKKTVGSVINRFGDSIDMIAFEWLVYAVTGSAAWTALILAFNQIPSVLVQPFAGVIVDGFDKKKVLIVTDVIRGLLVVTMAVLYVCGLLQPWMLAVLTFCISSVEAFNLPAGMAMLPKLLDKKYYEFGTSMNSTLSNISQLIGIGIAGVIIGNFGVQTAIIIDGVTFFLTAFITSTLKVAPEKLEKQPVDVKGYLQKLKEGFGYIRTRNAIFHFCMMAVLLNALFVPLNSLQTPLVVEVYGLGSELISVLGIGATVGMGLGTFVIPYIMRKVPVRRIVVIAGCGMGVCYACLTLGKYTYGQAIPSYILCGSVIMFLGFCMSCIMAVLNIQFMKSVEEKYLPRAGAIFNAAASVAAPLMSFLISALALKLSVASIFVVCAVMSVVVFAFVGIRKLEME